MLGPIRRARASLIAIAALCALLAAAAPALGAFGQRTLAMGDRGPSVRTLQTNLTTLGFSTPVTGRFGEITRRNVKRWEKVSGKKPNGVLKRSEAKLMSSQVATRGGTRQTTAGSDGSTRSSEGGAVGQSGGSAPTAPAAPAAALSPAPAAETSSSQFVFPVQGAHSYGTSINRFGAPRGGREHRGHDVLADCGVPLVAAEGGTVVYAGYQASGAGNYIVIKGAQTKRDYVYMHLQSPAYFKADATVKTGERIGLVGTTGSSTACHLHFEIWTSPGWYDGGEAIDPLSYLKEWDSTS